MFYIRYSYVKECNFLGVCCRKMKYELFLTTEERLQLGEMNITNATKDSVTPPLLQHVELLKHSLFAVAVFSVAYSVVMLLAWFSNSLVIITVCRTRSMHSLTNILIANLAVADITVSVIVLPITLLTNIFSGWFY